MGSLGSKAAQSGQILLVVILAAVVSLTVGLSVASRVLNNTKTTQDEVNAQQALSAAQAGIEQSLKSGSAVSNSFGSVSNYTTTVGNVGWQYVINAGNDVAQDDGADIWLSDHGPGTEPTYANPRTMILRVYWNDNSADCANNAAIELTVISGTAAGGGTASSVDRNAYDDCTTRRSTNNFTNPTDVSKTISGVTFDHYAQVSVTSGLIARVVPLYANTKLAIEMYDQNLNQLASPPSQGIYINSVGKAGGVTRTLSVLQGYSKLPSEFFYTVLIP